MMCDHIAPFCPPIVHWGLCFLIDAFGNNSVPIYQILLFNFHAKRILDEEMQIRKFISGGISRLKDC